MSSCLIVILYCIILAKHQSLNLKLNEFLFDCDFVLYHIGQTTPTKLEIKCSCLIVIMYYIILAKHHPQSLKLNEFLFNNNYTLFVVGILFSRCPSVRLSVRNVLFF